MSEQSTFKKSYEESMDVEGNINLTYKSKRKARVELIPILILPVFLPSCAGGIALSNWATGGLNGGEIIFGIILGFIAMVLISKLLFETKETITIKPGKGIAFQNKYLNFQDIDSIYIEDKINTYGRQQERISVVIAEAMGKKIELTRDLESALANIIFSKIKANADGRFVSQY